MARTIVPVPLPEVCAVVATPQLVGLHPRTIGGSLNVAPSPKFLRWIRVDSGCRHGQTSPGCHLTVIFLCSSYLLWPSGDRISGFVA